MGGGGRLDVRANLISLCRECHNKAHAGLISRAELLLLVSIREGMTPEQITEEIWRLRRKQKQC